MRDPKDIYPFLTVTGGVGLFGFGAVKDPEIEGKKKGYERAVKEYEPAFQKIKNEYEVTKKILGNEKASYNEKADALIKRLEDLERKEEILRRQVYRKYKGRSDVQDYEYPVDRTGYATAMLYTDIIGRKQKFSEAEKQGYLEAKKVYEAKIAKLKRDLAILKNKGNLEIQKLLNMIDDVLNVIADERMKIAELEMLLTGD